MGGYGAFRYGILHKDKFCALAAHAAVLLNLTEHRLTVDLQHVLRKNQPGPPYYFDYNTTGYSTKGMFLFCGASAPNFNTPQTHINPPILEFAIDENGLYIDTIIDKARDISINDLVRQLTPGDSVGILFGCGSAYLLRFFVDAARFI